MQLISSVVNQSDSTSHFWIIAVLLLSSNKGRVLGWIQVPSYNCPRRVWYISLILSAIWFYFKPLIVLLRVDLSLYWCLSEIISISGSPVSMFSGFRECMKYFSNQSKFTEGFLPATSYQSPYSTLTLKMPFVQENWVLKIHSRNWVEPRQRKGTNPFSHV